MKGLVFTEFLEMVEGEFGYDTVDKIIESSALPSGGHYTSIGNYPHREIVALVHQLSKATGISVQELLNQFGRHLLIVFSKKYPIFFESVTDSFQFLQHIDSYIHTEVLKICPDAELPKFETGWIKTGEFEMVYTSERKMSFLAEGLIRASLDYFNENATLSIEDLSSDGSKVRFLIKKV